ncbi:MAG: DUF5611 family protein [Candidatus Thermoplasmatota archaeon]|nr:DUF5611 family protein [Candidatus Thermoplasmatota archaeon]
MERFAVKRGLEKSIGGNAGLAEIAAEYFENVSADNDGVFNGSFGILTNVTGHFGEDGKLAVDVEQMKGGELEVLLSSEGGTEKAMESRRRWSSFLDKVTGYNGKQRGDKAKEWAKKASKAKSAISAAKHFMEMSENITDHQRSQANAIIDEIESLLGANENTKAAGRAEKLNKIFN